MKWAIFADNLAKKEAAAAILVRQQQSSHHQPDLVKVSSLPKNVSAGSELARLESILDEKNRENDQLKARLAHSAKGFAALAITVNHYAKKVKKINFERSEFRKKSPIWDAFASMPIWLMNGKGWRIDEIEDVGSIVRKFAEWTKMIVGDWRECRALLHPRPK